jgi:hypothetical protein
MARKQQIWQSEGNFLFTNDSTVEIARIIINLKNGNGSLYVTYALSPTNLRIIKTFMKIITNSEVGRIVLE